MEVSRTSMIHAAAPHFLWPFAVRYAAHQLNLWPYVSLPETSPTLSWTGEVGDASVFRVWDSRAFVRDSSADKLSARAIPSVFLGFPPDAPGLQFYHPTSRHPLPGTTPVEVAGDSSAARGAASGGVEPGCAEPGGVEPGGAESEGAESGGAEPWDPGAGGAGVAAGAGGTRGTAATGPRGTGAGGAGAVDPGAGGTVRPQSYFVPLLQQTGGLTERREPESRPFLPVHTARRVPCSRPLVPGTHAMTLRPSSVPLRVPLPPPLESSLPSVPDPESDHAHAANLTVSRLLATVVTDPSFESTAASALIAELLDFAAPCRLDYTTALVAESESVSPPSIGGECALCTDVLEDRQEEFECLAAAVPRFASMQLAPEGDPDAPNIPTPRSYAEAITGTYVYTVPLSRANIVDGMWIFRVKRPPGSPPAFKAHYVARGFSQRQGVDYLHTFTAFLQGGLRKEIWLRRPPGFTGSFPAITQWSLRRLVYGLRQSPREWHDTLRTTLAALRFAPSTADLSLFLRTDTSLPPFYVLIYVDDLVFATADTEALTLVKSELQKRHTFTDVGKLHSYPGLQITRDRARRTINLTQSHMVHLDDYYLCVPPDPGIEAAALDARDSSHPGTAPAEALHTFTLDSGASLCFFRDSTTLTPLPAPVPVRLADSSGGPVLAHSSTVLLCPAVPSGSLFEVVDVLIPWIRAVRLQLRERFRTNLPVLRLHSDECGEFSSDLLRDFCRGEGIL
ncbi:unnamed protein product [Closterium sp. NIES-53]